MCDNNDLNNQTFGVGEESNTPPTPQYVTYIPYGLTPEKFEERKSIKKTSNTIGISLLIAMTVPKIIAYLLVVIFFALGLSNGTINSILNDSAANNFFQIIISALCFSLPFILVFNIAGYKVRDLIDFSKPKKNIILPLFLMGIAVCAFSNIATGIAGNFFKQFGINYEVDFNDDFTGIFGFLLSFIATAVIPPLIEEFAFRGVVLGVLRKYGDTFAIIVSSVVFGVMHGNFQQMPFTFLVGLVLAYITVKSGSIWIAVAVHAFNNAISVVFTALEKVIPTDFLNGMYVILLAVLLLLGILSLLLCKKRNISYEVSESENVSSEAEKYKWFFLSATMIIFIILMLAEALQYFV